MSSINSEIDLSQEIQKIILDGMEMELKMPPKDTIQNRIKCWLDSTSFAEFTAAISERVKGQDRLNDVLACVYIYLKNIAEGNTYKSNVLISAPSGCGKTETFRALRDYFSEEIPKLPIYQIDMTQITEEGFKGHDTNDIVKPLFDKYTDGIAIVFLDELDKKLLPSYDNNRNDVNAAVQSQILTLIEGREVISKEDSDLHINTANTMFIGCGSFNHMREVKQRESDKHSIGFNLEEKKKADHYDDITMKDVIDQGASYELLGRFALLVNYHKLSEDAINSIVDDMVEKVGKGLGIEIVVSDKMREQLQESANSEYGCRRIMSIIQETTMRPYIGLLNKGKSLDRFCIVLEEIGWAHTKRIKNCKRELAEASSQ